ncbi:MAG: hypothetical protein Q8K92_11075 [Leadbetterella sp.]|nr:hypothetical protein [Leadbetterella sp.]
MLKIRNSILVLILLFITACAERNPNNANLKGNKFPDSTVLAFIKWYHKNENKIQKNNLIKGGLKDTTTFYSIDFTNTEKYLTELSKSNCVSEKFISDFRNFFKQSDMYLKENPQLDGPVNGFESDLIMKSQDYMEVWNYLDRMKTLKTSIQGNKAIIKVSFGKYYRPSYNLTKHSNYWLIDSIYNVYSDN